MAGRCEYSVRKEERASPVVDNDDTLPFMTKQHTHDDDDGSSHTTEDSDNNLDDTSDAAHISRTPPPRPSTATSTARTSNTATPLRAPVRGTTATIEMIVTDTGPDLAPHRLPAIFTPFPAHEIVRVSRIRRHGPGMVDCIAARIPCSASRCTYVGQGSTFTVRFPVQVVVVGDADDDDDETVDVSSVPDYDPLLGPRPTQHRSIVEAGAHYRSHVEQGSPKPLFDIAAVLSSALSSRRRPASWTALTLWLGQQQQ
jgi:hypothetical protein